MGVSQVMDELDFFTKLDHPNCHYLLGAKTTLENGGILVSEWESELDRCSARAE